MIPTKKVQLLSTPITVFLRSHILLHTNTLSIIFGNISSIFRQFFRQYFDNTVPVSHQYFKKQFLNTKTMSDVIKLFRSIKIFQFFTNKMALKSRSSDY